MGLYGQQKIMSRNWNQPPAQGKEISAEAIWNEMIDRCYSKTIPREIRMQSHVSSRFRDYRGFWAWFQEQPGSNLLSVVLNKDLLFEGNRVYSDATCVLLPREIHDVLMECRIDRSDLEALKIEFGSSGQASGENSVEGAYNAAKQEVEATLKLLAEKYRHELDPRAYRALIQYEIKVQN